MDGSVVLARWRQRARCLRVNARRLFVGHRSRELGTIGRSCVPTPASRHIIGRSTWGLVASDPQKLPFPLRYSAASYRCTVKCLQWAVQVSVKYSVKLDFFGGLKHKRPMAAMLCPHLNMADITPPDKTRLFSWILAVRPLKQEVEGEDKWVWIGMQIERK